MRLIIVIFYTRHRFCIQFNIYWHRIYSIAHYSPCKIQTIWYHTTDILLSYPCNGVNTFNWRSHPLNPFRDIFFYQYSASKQFYRELLDTAAITWHRMRGTQMIAAVKVISIAFDLDRKKIRHFPSFVEFWGYILCPGNVIMGPWCAYNDYLYLFHRTKFVSWILLNYTKNLIIIVFFFLEILYLSFLYLQSFVWMYQALLNGTIAIFFLLASNCYIDAYVPSLHFKWVKLFFSQIHFQSI